MHDNNIPITRLIAGLGNPGVEYEKTRHNIGFTVIDSLMRSLGPKKWKKKDKFDSVFWEGRFRGESIFLQKPLAFMNASGKPVSGLLSFLNLNPEELLIIYDDMDLPLGKIRLRKNGSASSHKGVESVISELQTDVFARLRIGIGNDGGNNWKDYVLDKFSEEEFEIMNNVVERSTEAVKTLLYSGVEKAMNDFNGITIQK